MLYRTGWRFLFEGRQNELITRIPTHDGKPKFLTLCARLYHLLGVIDTSDLTRYQLSKSTLLSIRTAKWLTALCKTRHFAGQTGDARAENSFAALILIGCRDVKQLRLANEILRMPFQCQSWQLKLARICTCSLCSSVELEIFISKWRISIFLVKTRT